MHPVTREDVNDYLWKILKEKKKIDITGMKNDTSLKMLELDSFGFLEVIFSLEHQYDIDFPKEYEHIQTIGDVSGITYNLVLNKLHAQSKEISG